MLQKRAMLNSEILFLPELTSGPGNSVKKNISKGLPTDTRALRDSMFQV
jgi:hypothetical protein